MTKKAIIERTIKVINQLPNDKAEEISDFADFVMKRFEEQNLTEGLQNMVSDSEAFNFLNKEEDLYSLSDIKEPCNG